MAVRRNPRQFGNLNGRYGAHQVSFYLVPAGGNFHTTAASRLGHFLHRLLRSRRKPAGHYPTTTEQRRNFDV